MSIRKVIWMLVLIMTFGVGAPAAAYADTADLALDAVEEAAKTTKKKKKTSEETAKAETEEQNKAEDAEAVIEKVTEESEKHTKEETSKEETSKGEVSKKDPIEDIAADIIAADLELEEKLRKEQEKAERENHLAESETEMEEEAAREEQSAQTNDDLLKMQHIVMPEVTEMAYEFRFSKDEEAPQALLQAGSCIYEGRSEEAPVVGISVSGSVVYILADAEDEWVFVESGEVRGFVRSTDLADEDMLQTIITEGDPTVFRDAYMIIAPMDNLVVDYTLTTGYDVVLEDPEQVIAVEDMAIYSTADTEAEDAEVVGTLKKNGMAYVITEVDEDTLYLESGDVRGFAKTSEFLQGEEAEAKLKKASKKGKELVTAECEIPAEDNPALHYTLTSIKEPVANAQLRSSIINFATQFVGNPYVWGGESLTNGADCSGFVKQVYKYFGYELPRTSRVQARYGTQIPVSAALPGDLIFYAQNGTVYHVAMYIGNGMTVQAKGAAYGIVVCPIGSNAVWATRVIAD